MRAMKNVCESFWKLSQDSGKPHREEVHILVRLVYPGKIHQDGTNGVIQRGADIQALTANRISRCESMKPR